MAIGLVLIGERLLPAGPPCGRDAADPKRDHGGRKGADAHKRACMPAYDPAAAPALLGWRATAIALGCALLIGGVGGLIGLGGGEFRLPILVAMIGFTARSAVPMNQILSLVTLV